MTQDSAGAAAQREYRPRHDRRQARFTNAVVRHSPIVKFLAEDPHSMGSWAKGSAGERELAGCLEDRVGDRAVVLHDRRIPQRWANIDHIVVAPSGVWVVDAKTYLGEIRRRDSSRWHTTEDHVYVDDRDRTALVGGLAPQVEAVQAALGALDVPLHAALCFVDVDWSMWLKAFTIAGVWVTPPRMLAWMIAKPGPLTPGQVLAVGERLNGGLRPG